MQADETGTNPTLSPSPAPSTVPSISICCMKSTNDRLLARSGVLGFEGLNEEQLFTLLGS